MDIATIIVGGLSLPVIVMALTQLLKVFGISGAWVPRIAILVGVVLLIWQDGATLQTIVNGIVGGLAGVGAWEVGKSFSN